MRRTNRRAALKEALNRQFVTLGSYMPLERGLFECRQAEGLASEPQTISFKPFERAYPLVRRTQPFSLETR